MHIFSWVLSKYPQGRVWKRVALEGRERRGNFLNTIPGGGVANRMFGTNEPTPTLLPLTRAYTIAHPHAKRTHVYPPAHAQRIRATRATHTHAYAPAHAYMWARTHTRYAHARTHTPTHAACNFFQWKENVRPKLSDRPPALQPQRFKGHRQNFFK